MNQGIINDNCTTSKNGPEVTVFNGIVQSNSSNTQDLEKHYQSMTSAPGLGPGAGAYASAGAAIGPNAGAAHGSNVQ